MGSSDFYRYNDKTDKMTKPWDASHTRALDADDLSALLTGADKTQASPYPSLTSRTTVPQVNRIIKALLL